MSECPRRRKAGILFKNSFDFGIFPDFVPRFYVLYQLARIVLQSCNMSWIFNIWFKTVVGSWCPRWTIFGPQKWEEIFLRSPTTFCSAHLTSWTQLAWLQDFLLSCSSFLSEGLHLYCFIFITCLSYGVYSLSGIFGFWNTENNFQHQKTNEKGIFIETRIIPA